MGFAFTSGDVWPLARAKPCIEGVVVADIGIAIDFDFGLVYSFVENPICGVVDVLEGWNRDSPRDLARDIPIFELFKVVDENLFFAGGVKFDLPCSKHLDSLFGKWFNIDKPLLHEKRFDNGIAFVAVSDRMLDVFFASEEVLFLEIFENFFASIGDSEVFVVSASICVHFAIETNDGNHVEAVTLTNLIIVLVVCWCNFYNTGAVFDVGMLVGDNRDFAFRKR